MTATTFSSIPYWINANFKAFGTAWGSALSSFGLVKVPDTGTIDWTTTTYAGTTNTAGGWEIWRMDDTLQATAPCFIKFEYGSGTNPGCPVIWLTIGSGSDGAGNLTGNTSVRKLLYTTSNNGSSHSSILSGSTNRLAAMLFYSATEHISMVIERTHSPSGEDTGDGILLLGWSANAATGYLCQYVPFSGVVPPDYQHWNATIPPSGTGAQSGNIYTWPVRCWGPSETNPVLGCYIYFGVDLTAGNQITMTCWDGVSRNFYPTGKGSTSYLAYGGGGLFLMRYD